MGRVMVVAAVSLDGFIADPSDEVGPLFDWYDNGEVAIAPGDPEQVFHVSEPTAQYMRKSWTRVGACVIGRRLFDITNGWNGRPAAGDAVFVVTHEAPTDWPFPAAPFTFVTDGVRSAIEQAQAFAGDRDVTVTAGDIGRQVLDEGLADEVVLCLAPAVLGTGIPFFGEIAKPPLLLENPTVIEGDRVTHLIYPVRKH
ncbi:MAG TPA: dihydrofolate reductase family protein [Jatrophihabitantaceae bacterium]|jgi:dihydrofolate reductase